MRIAITGGSGSLGSALIRSLAHSGAERIVTVSRDEQKRAAMQRELSWFPGFKAYAGDIRERDRLVDVFDGCEVVVHAAARKVVNGHHDEPPEMLATNVLGTRNVLAAARQARVGKVLLVSSDKAVHAENVYGVSKAMAEHLTISENARCWPRGQRMSVIRYGNVFASNGSVLRVWRQCLAEGRPLPFSDTRMTRFWLTLDQAVGFVLAAVAQMRGGEVLVPKLKAAPLTAVAEALGSTPDQWQDMGIRPGGEKLFEELVSADEARRAVSRNQFYVIAPTDGMDSWDTSAWIGERVPAGFEYRSDTWPDRLAADELRVMVGGGR